MAWNDSVKPWWRHQMEAFSSLLARCEGNKPVTGGFPSQRPATRSFDFFICARTNGSENNRDVGDLNRHRAHYDVTVMTMRCNYTSVSSSLPISPAKSRISICASKLSPSIGIILHLHWHIVHWFFISFHLHGLCQHTNPSTRQDRDVSKNKNLY